MRAIDKAIRQWSRIVDAMERGGWKTARAAYYDDECTLCSHGVSLYMYGCKNCPIYHATGQRYCHGIPQRLLS